MSEVVSKVKKFDEFLEKQEVKFFQKVEAGDDLHTAIFQATLEAASQRFDLRVWLDDSIYTMVRTIVVPTPVAEENRPGVERYLNELNSQFKIFKYYLDPRDGAIYLDISIPGAPDEFNPELPMFLIANVLLPHVEEFYPEIMKRVWNKEEVAAEKKEEKSEAKKATKKN